MSSFSLSYIVFYIRTGSSRHLMIIVWIDFELHNAMIGKLATKRSLNLFECLGYSLF